jgi:hypothetical protein
MKNAGIRVQIVADDNLILSRILDRISAQLRHIWGDSSFAVRGRAKSYQVRNAKTCCKLRVGVPLPSSGGSLNEGEQKKD